MRVEDWSMICFAQVGNGLHENIVGLTGRFQPEVIGACHTQRSDLSRGPE